MGGILRYRVGSRARRRLEESGLRPDVVAAIVGTATGPRWLALAGLDRALLEAGLVAGTGPTRRLLVGASAGAWRMLALASSDPRRRHAALVEAYVSQVFPRGSSPQRVSKAYRDLVATVFPPEEVAAILDHPAVDVGLLAVRIRRGLPRRSRLTLGSGLLLAGLLNLVTPRAVTWLFERVLFHSRPRAFRGTVRGRVVTLDAGGLPSAALASGTVPLALAPVVDPPGAPPGTYLDGGVTDYHLATRWVPAGEGVVLLPHHERRVAPGWFDKRLARWAPADLLADVLQIAPDPAWVASLPGGRVPDRRDFLELVDDPARRIRRWLEVVGRSEELGAVLLDDVESGRLVDRLEPLGPP